MGAIDIKLIREVKPHSVDNDLDPNIVVEDEYLYKDIKLDLDVGSVVGNLPADKPVNTADFDDLRNVEDVKQSVSNILNTRPGQKLLNPALGLDLSKFCFEQVNTITGDLIARAITAGLPQQEPRIVINNLTVICNTDNATYACSFNMSLRKDITKQFQLNGMLDTNGFKFN